MADTANFTWTKPTVDGSDGAWGTILNTLFDDIDSDLNSVKTTADAALPKAGGTLTGEVQLKTVKNTAVNLGSSLSGSVALDLSAGDFFYGTATGDVSFSISNAPSSGPVVFIMIELTDAGTHTITWPASFAWPSGSGPRLTDSGVDIVAAYSYDGGTTWRAALAQKDSR